MTVLNSTIARNLAVAHVGGGVWSRGRPVRRELDGQRQLRRGHRAAACSPPGRAHARQLHRRRQHRARSRRTSASASGSRRSARSSGRRRSTSTAARRSRPTRTARSPAAHVARLQRRHRRVVPVRRPRRHRRVRAVAGAARARTAARETRLPQAASPALDRVPLATAASHPSLPAPLEGEQHLAGLVEDLGALLRTDERGVPRPQGPACDAGAVEVTK